MTGGIFHGQKYAAAGAGNGRPFQMRFVVQFCSSLRSEKISASRGPFATAVRLVIVLASVAN